MHEITPLIQDLAVILGIAGIVTLLCRRIHQPVVLGYLIAGMIIGPYTPPHSLIEDIPNVKTLSELGVIFLMFSLGLEFSFHKLKRVGLSASLAGIIEVIGMMALGMFIGEYLRWPFFDSLFLGAALAVSSTTIIIKALEELHLKKHSFAELIFGILIIEDLLAMLLLVGLSTVVASQDILSFHSVFIILKLIVVIGAWFLIGYFLVPSLMRKISPYASEENLTIVSVALCLFLVCIAAYFHYSVALGAFIMGSILAETPLVSRIEKLIQPIRDIFAAVFFVAVGMLIDPMIIWQHLGLVVLISFITIVGKIIAAGLGSFLTGKSPSTSIHVGFSMAQIGEFSFIIASLGVALSATSSIIYPIIVAVSAITTFTTPYLIRASLSLEHYFKHTLPPPQLHFFESYTLWKKQPHKRKSAASILKTSKLRWFINAIAVVIVFTLVEKLFLHQLSAIFNSQLWLVRNLCWLFALLLSSPFIWGMLMVFNVKKLHLFDVSLTAGNLLLILIELTLLSNSYFTHWKYCGILIIVMICWFMIFHRQLAKIQAWLADHLLNNLNLPQ